MHHLQLHLALVTITMESHVVHQVRTDTLLEIRVATTKIVAQAAKWVVMEVGHIPHKGGAHNMVVVVCQQADREDPAVVTGWAPQIIHKAVSMETHLELAGGQTQWAVTEINSMVGSSKDLWEILILYCFVFFVAVIAVARNEADIYLSKFQLYVCSGSNIFVVSFKEFQKKRLCESFLLQLMV